MTTMRHKIQESERIIKGLENEVILKNNLVNVLKQENSSLVEIFGQRKQERAESQLADR